MLAGCTPTGGGTDTGCRGDDWCPAGSYCELDTGWCLCSDDSACDEGEVCNDSGACMWIGGCRDDLDCMFGSACDTDSGVCLCVDDSPCREGEICNDSGHCEDTWDCRGDDDCGPGGRCELSEHLCYCATDEACEGWEFCNDDGACQPKAACTLESGCRPGWHCDEGRGLCLCDADSSCPAGETCNDAGFCQPDSGACRSSADCESEGEICDPATQRCLAASCTNHNHCPFGQICQQGTCVDGCEGHGDCPLGEPGARWACLEGQCSGGPEQPNLCVEDSWCLLGQRCLLGNCTDQPGEFCQPCESPSYDNPEPCGDRINYCLINVNYQPDGSRGSAEFCGVDCSDGQSCPLGYQCHNVSMVSPPDPENPGGTPFCGSHSDCIGEGRRCTGGEGDLRGTCTCATDSHCPTDFCDWSLILVGLSPSCALSGKLCNSDDQCPISCVEGRCHIGANCGPAEGYDCVSLGVQVP